MPRKGKTKHPELVEVGWRLKEAMARAHMEREDLARAVKTTPGSVSYWREGSREMGEATLLRVAEALGVSANWLSTGQAEERTPLDELDTSYKEAIALASRLQEIVDRLRVVTGVPRAVSPMPPPHPEVPGPIPGSAPGASPTPVASPDRTGPHVPTGTE